MCWNDGGVNWSDGVGRRAVGPKTKRRKRSRQRGAYQMFSIGSLVSSTWLQGVADVAVVVAELAAHGVVTMRLTSARKDMWQGTRKIGVTLEFGFEREGRVKYGGKPIALVVSRAIMLFLRIHRLLPVLLMAAGR